MPMQAEATVSNRPLEQIVDQIFATHKITRSDQQHLMSLFSSRSLNPRDISLLNRVYDGLNKGLVRVVD